MPPKQANKFDKLNTMTKEQIIEWNFGSSSRPLQGKHGNNKKKTAACHRFTRSEVKYLIADGAGMSHADVVQLVLWADGDKNLFIQPAQDNHKHSLHEQAVTRARKAAENVHSSTADRIDVMLKSVRRGFETGALSQKNAERLIARLSHVKINNVSVLHALSDRTETVGAAKSDFAGLCKQAVQKTSEVPLLVNDAKLTKVGVIKQSSKVVRDGHLRFNQDNSVDRTCTAFRRGLVDEQGSPIKAKRGKSPILQAEKKRAAKVAKQKQIASDKRCQTGLQADGTPDKRTVVGRKLFEKQLADQAVAQQKARAQTPVARRVKQLEQQQKQAQTRARERKLQQQRQPVRHRQAAVHHRPQKQQQQRASVSVSASAGGNSWNHFRANVWQSGSGSRSDMSAAYASWKK